MTPARRRRHVASWFLALPLAVACGGGSSTGGEAQGALTGTVQDVHTRAAIGGVNVEFEGKSTRSDRHGRFRFEGVALEEGGLLTGTLKDGRSGSLRVRGGGPGGRAELEVLLSLE